MEKTILVVDDQLDIRELLYDALTKKQYKVVTTHSGKEAIEYVKAHKPDLVLLDFKMSDMDGVEALQRIKETNESIKVVMLTAFSDEDLERQARSLGAGGFLKKTLGIDVIVKAVDEVVQPKSGYKKEKILVVDDDNAIQTLIKDFLIKKGYEVAVAASGEEALDIFNKEKPALILLDIKLPGMDGIMTLRRLRDIDQKVGVIMVTGVKDEESFQEAKKFGAYEYIVKPFDLNYLETCVLVRLCIVQAMIS